ncbi:TPA: MepB family protein [Staphylococcus aureus]|uniref:MepB family protein n=1 Tax=Staphylococcus aureus TaxID=1280 RepID=UPI0028DE1687|nr:MepB family protein [Staphylococcus aureus]WOL35415.1 MepB family protein [Staphylococcus aureus]HDL0563398.1 MepB family protein [Staphylococcus aureus]HDL0566099.1 MepB family protein [Staphylococcus aureus]HDL0618002.1 MepB family protein [Staphylococcus aureus]HDL0636906.1 MepB family protein [Staphylococcus aureus]
MYKSRILLKYIFSEESDVKDLTEEKYNQDYEALTFSFKEETYQSRLAKKTPTKAAYFVTCWTKDENNCNQPYSKEAFVDYLMIIVIDEELSGYFLFPRELLVEKGILTTFEHKGKMAFRVYPKWCNQLNKRTEQTQNWQCKYFFEY